MDGNVNSQKFVEQMDMMEDFIGAYSDKHVRKCLSVAISGRSTFQCFKDPLIRFGVEDRWYASRDPQMIEFVWNWCEENQVSCDMEEIR